MAKTIMMSARSGSTPEEIEKLAKLEGLPVEKLRTRIAEGRIAILRNVRRLDRVKIVGVGEGLFTKVNVNLGTSGTVVDVDMELEKARIARRYGSDTVMDLSMGGSLDEIRRKIMREAEPLPLGTVPTYQAWVEGIRKYGGLTMPSDWFLGIVERQLRDGVDYMTIHAALTRELALKAVRSSRVIPITSRGGALLAAWMLENGEENPYRKHWDYLLELFAEYDAVISVGDSLRPGALADQHDEFQVGELIEAARLVRSAREAGVQTIVEGPGHMTLDQIPANVRLMKALTGGAPYYVLGPLVTDIAMGYDHIAFAIGGAVAAASGADYLCYVTPAEHLSLPNPEQVKEGLIAAKIAAHAADLAKYGARAARRDAELSLLRARLDWERMWSYALDPEHAKKIYSQFPSATRACNMCGQYCACLVLGKFARGRREPSAEELLRRFNDGGSEAMEALERLPAP
ncbi:phosphomethylpyrimidine synthase [Pyrodictium occultum]|uniref:Phosphomethylpyrimidine synthase n=1 Tax=Pyrodictium occultum TaxID=2309 RepID=A0A0V8RTY7_PYROC|nr:phosphomethylpyrimidine synthase ThiC [Pyrodictium occultum]KSW11534.1 phosphomethylpyrimidine synthase [Pyrodictium occultum]